MRQPDEITRPCIASVLTFALTLLLAVAAPATPAGAAHRHNGAAKLRPGQVVMSYAEGNQACAIALGYPRSDWAHPQSLPPDDHGAVAINVVKGEGPLLDDGVIVLSCGHGAFSKTTTIVGYDLIRRRILWAKPLAGADTYAVTQHHLLAVIKHKAPPKGLKGSSTAWRLVQYDLRTGHWEINSELPADAPGEGFWGVWEGPPGGLGLPEGILLQYKGSAYYAGGQVLWHTGRVVPNYVGYGIAEEDTHKEATYGDLTQISGPQDGIIAFNVQTGAVAWQETLPQPCDLPQFITDFGPSELVGSVLWSHGQWDDEEGHRGYCIVAHEVTTGQVIADTLYSEANGEYIAADHEHLIAWGHGTLSGYSTTDASHPLWSEPAAETTPLAVSGARVLVAARSGLLILSTATGKIEGRVPKDFLAEEGNNVSVTNGLAANFLQYGEVEVVDLDR